jgi:hypothetical protein
MTTKMTPTMDYPENNSENPHHRNFKTIKVKVLGGGFIPMVR